MKKNKTKSKADGEKTSQVKQKSKYQTIFSLDN